MRKRMMLCNIAIIIVGFCAAFLTATLLVQGQYEKEFTKQLDTALAVLSTQSEALENPGKVSYELGEALKAAGQPIRITILDEEGHVLGDSEDKEITENHANRPEIVEAREKGVGYDTRSSASMGIPYYYEARRVGQYYLRAALPMGALQDTIQQMWLDAALGMLFGIVMVCVASGLFVSWIGEPVRRMSLAARRLAAGEYSSRVEGTFSDEFAELAQAFNQMADSTEHAVSLLRTKQEQLEGVLQGMNDGVLAVDEGGNVLFLNQSARSLLHCPSMQAGDHLEGSLVLTKISALLRDAMQAGEPVNDELTNLPEETRYTVYAAPMEAQPTGAALAVVSDVTRIRRLEQLRSEFVSNVTHELKTPLTSIRGSIELLKSADRDEETRRYFYDVLDIETERLTHLIDDLLVLSQIENAKEDPSMRPCNVKEALEHCVERAKSLGQENHIRMHIDADSELFVACTPTRLQQLFGNLIDNAVKYNVKDGSVFITAQRQRQTAVVRVKDTGIGIAKEHFPRLFERFYRVDTSRSREIGGTGLGLSIVKHLVALYGGEIGVESEPGKGTTFTVCLPLAPKEK